MPSHDSPAIRARFATILDDIDFDLCGRMLTFKTASTRLHEPATEFRINPEFLREENIYVPLLKSRYITEVLRAASCHLVITSHRLHVDRSISEQSGREALLRVEQHARRNAAPLHSILFVDQRLAYRLPSPLY